MGKVEKMLACKEPACTDALRVGTDGEESPLVLVMAPSPSSAAETEADSNARPAMAQNDRAKIPFAVDETPTPSRYIRHQYTCEGLFEEVCVGLNPFDEQFRRASQARTQPHINLESSTPHIMEVSSRYGIENANTNNSSSSHGCPANKNYNSKAQQQGNVSYCSGGDESLDTPRIVPPTPADSDHTISSTSRDENYYPHYHGRGHHSQGHHHHHHYQRHHHHHSQYGGQNHSQYSSSYRDSGDCVECEEYSSEFEKRDGGGSSKQYRVTSSYLSVPKAMPFRSISELSASMSGREVTINEDGEEEEMGDDRLNRPDGRMEGDIRVDDDDDGASVTEFNANGSNQYNGVTSKRVAIGSSENYRQRLDSTSASLDSSLVSPASANKARILNEDHYDFRDGCASERRDVDSLCDDSDIEVDNISDNNNVVLFRNKRCVVRSGRGDLLQSDKYSKVCAAAMDTTSSSRPEATNDVRESNIAKAAPLLRLDTDDASIVTSPNTSNTSASSVLSASSSCCSAGASSPVVVGLMRRVTGGRHRQQKLSINVTSAVEAGRSSSSTVISTPTPVITAGPSLTQCLRESKSSVVECSADDHYSTPTSPPYTTTTATMHHNDDDISTIISSSPSRGDNASSFYRHNRQQQNDCCSHANVLGTSPGVDDVMNIVAPSSRVSPSLSSGCSYTSSKQRGQDSSVGTGASVAAGAGVVAVAAAGTGAASRIVAAAPALTPASPSATVLQLFLRLPNGQAIPVEIPATPLLGTSVASTLPSSCSSSTTSGSSPSQHSVPPAPGQPQHQQPSLAKMRLKAALTSNLNAARPLPRPHPSRALTAHRIAAMTQPNYTTVDSSKSNSNNNSKPTTAKTTAATDVHHHPPTQPCAATAIHHQQHESNNSEDNVNKTLMAAHQQQQTNGSNDLAAAAAMQQLHGGSDGAAAAAISAVAAALYGANMSDDDGIEGATRGKKRCHPLADEGQGKRLKFLERNRAAAVRCREKKKEWVIQLASKSTELATVNTRLQTEVANLKAEVATLKTLLLQHRTCPVTLAALQDGQGENPLLNQATLIAVQVPPNKPEIEQPDVTADNSNKELRQEQQQEDSLLDLSNIGQLKPRSRSMSLPSIHASLPADVSSASNSGLAKPVINVVSDLNSTAQINRKTSVPAMMLNSYPFVVSDNVRIGGMQHHPAIISVSQSSFSSSQPPTFISVSNPSLVTSFHHPVSSAGAMPSVAQIPTLMATSQHPAIIAMSHPTYQLASNFSSSSNQTATATVNQLPAIAPAPPNSSSQPPVISSSSKEQFTLTSLASSIQSVQSSLTSSSRILSALESSPLREFAVKATTAAAVALIPASDLAAKITSNGIMIDPLQSRMLMSAAYSAQQQLAPLTQAHVAQPQLLTQQQHQQLMAHSLTQSLAQQQQHHHQLVTQNLAPSLVLSHQLGHNLTQPTAILHHQLRLHPQHPLNHHHVVLPSIDEVPSTAAIIEDIAEIEEDNCSKMAAAATASANTTPLRLSTDDSLINNSMKQVSDGVMNHHDRLSYDGSSVQSSPQHKQSPSSQSSAGDCRQSVANDHQTSTRVVQPDNITNKQVAANILPPVVNCSSITEIVCQNHAANNFLSNVLSVKPAIAVSCYPSIFTTAASVLTSMPSIVISTAPQLSNNNASSPVTDSSFNVVPATSINFTANANALAFVSQANIETRVTTTNVQTVPTNTSGGVVLNSLGYAAASPVAASLPNNRRDVSCNDTVVSADSLQKSSCRISPAKKSVTETETVDASRDEVSTRDDSCNERLDITTVNTSDIDVSSDKTSLI